MVDFIADAAQLDSGSIIGFITGTGGGLVMAWFFVKSLQEDKKQLLGDLRIERDRNQEFGDAFLALAAETRLHLISAPGSVKELYVKVEAEHRATRATVIQKADELGKKFE